MDFGVSNFHLANLFSRGTFNRDKLGGNSLSIFYSHDMNPLRIYTESSCNFLYGDEGVPVPFDQNTQQISISEVGGSHHATIFNTFGLSHFRFRTVNKRLFNQEILRHLLDDAADATTVSGVDFYAY
jgi:hypothetical protein